MTRATKIRIRHWIAVATVALAVLGFAAAVHAGQPGGFCCVCACVGDFRCVTVATPSACGDVCEGVNCTISTLNNSCSALPLECPQAFGAPVIGRAESTAMALILAGLGVLGLRRAARRRRA